MSAEAAELLRRRRAVSADTSLRGRSLCTALAAITDEWLQALLDDATGGNTAGLALVAVGGYGRLELAPGSDLDVWLLHDGRKDVRELAERLWYPVWDAGFKLGHAVRTHREALAMIGDDLDTATAALSARHVGGDPSVSKALAEDAGIRWRRRSSRWLVELDRRVKVRHETAGEVAFLLEPDLKEGRGGLRDCHSLAWAEAARSVLLAGDAATLHRAEDVLLDVRVALHRAAPKPTDVLLLDHQDEVAKLLGEDDADTLMAHLATAARTVAWVSDEVWRRAERTQLWRSRVFRRDRSLGEGLRLRNGDVHVEDDAHPKTDCTLVLRAGAAAAAVDAPIDRMSLDLLAQQAPSMPDPWPEEARDALVALLGQGRPAIAVLEALDQRGLLERVLPEWGAVRSKPQRNALHRFTVDRHLCEAAANAAGLANQVSRPDLLLVGTWLHDIGKGYPGDHTEVGMELVTRIGRRMGFPPDDVDVLVTMVRLHLVIPETATRRDLGDDEVIRTAAESVGSLQVLELLAVLAEADGRATGPTAWNAWKAGLVSELVDRVAFQLRGEEGEEPRQPGGFPSRSLLETMSTGRTVVTTEDGWLTVVAPDRPGLFSRVAGALALKGVTIYAADAHSEEGMAASRFRVEAPPRTELDWEEVIRDVRRAIEGRLAIDARLAQRSRTARRPAGLRLVGEPTVRVDNNVSGGSTVVEVRAPDRPGALYRITRALADIDLDIRIAKISTLGTEVYDTFYVRTAAGAKLVDRDHVRELERAILYQLSL
ncbi:MAG TPA: [protein-PII] uridylyltransferase [Acidimicrobiales bacterium]